MHSFKVTSYLGWFEWVIRREVDRDKKYSQHMGYLMDPWWSLASGTYLPPLGMFDIPTKACILVQWASRNSNLNFNFRQLCLRFLFRQSGIRSYNIHHKHIELKEHAAYIPLACLYAHILTITMAHIFLYGLPNQQRCSLNT
jgi:hypothetical protein